jgi:hypothetical protein
VVFVCHGFLLGLWESRPVWLVGMFYRRIWCDRKSVLKFVVFFPFNLSFCSSDRSIFVYICNSAVLYSVVSLCLGRSFYSLFPFDVELRFDTVKCSSSFRACRVVTARIVDSVLILFPPTGSGLPLLTIFIWG